MNTENQRTSGTSPRRVRKLSHRALLSKLHELLCEEHALEAELLLHMGEVDRRRLYRERGFSSMFRYCTDELHLSESVAYNRIAVARAVCKHPVLLEAIRNGELHLSGACLLVPHLTENNAHELTKAAKHKSKRAIEELLANRRQQPDIPARVRKLPSPRTAEPQQESPFVGTSSLSLAPREGPSPSPALPSGRCEVAPLGGERFKVQFTADAQLQAKLQKAQDLLGPRVSCHDLATVFSKALDLLISDLENKKHGVTSRPQKRRDGVGKPGSLSRTIPRSVRRKVYERDGGRCKFVSAQGRRCEERSGLEYHHLIPFGQGGASTVQNVELRCKSHNQLAAEQDYGEAWMARYWPKGVREAGAEYRVGRRTTGAGGSLGPPLLAVAPHPSGEPALLCTMQEQVRVPKEPAASRTAKRAPVPAADKSKGTAYCPARHAHDPLLEVIRWY